MNEVVREFLLETHENLAQLDLDLVTLEKDPTERETLARVFRTLHTVKGSAGFLGFPRLEKVAHAAENLLSRLRAGSLVLTPEMTTALLAVIDAIRRVVAHVEQDGTEGTADFSELIRTLETLNTAAAKDPHISTTLVGNPNRIVATTTIGTLPKPAGEVPAPPPPKPDSVAPKSVPSTAAVISPTIVAEPPSENETRNPAVADSAIRVDVGLLDKLMTLVGELVLTRNQIVQYSNTQEDGAFTGTVQRLNLLTTELQAGVMKTRMQPIGNIWSKFPRIVRDLALACGKQARIDMDGKDTELDRTIIEAIRDPLTHLVRNAVDHGLEPPNERLARGKPAEGRLSLNASHEGGKVIIEISDDGAGIDPKRVAAKAITSKLISAEQADRLNERELVNLIFLPGFSTTEKVTNFSGRGVGMDVVKTNVEKIGGTVDIESRLGRGTTVKMKIPLTLAIIPALIISTGGDRYAIPQVSLLELVRLEGEAAQKGIERIHGAPVYRLRGNLLPLVYLDRELQVERLAPEGEVNIVVLQADDRQFGLIVDAIHDTEEIVVKPLQKQLKGITAFAGVTIMGDGRLALILDVLGLAQSSHVVSGVRGRLLEEKPPAQNEKQADRQSLLLFSTRDGARMAVPLAHVARLEEFSYSAIEESGEQQVIQYRDEILPLFDVAELLRQLQKKERKHSEANGDVVPVVVYAGKGRNVGLVVGQIIDIVEEELAIRARANRPGVLFTAIVQGRVTEFVDVEGLILAFDPGFFDPAVLSGKG